MKTNIATIVFACVVIGCNSSGKEKRPIEKKKVPTPVIQEAKYTNARPTYEILYSPHLVKLDSVSYTDKIDQETAIRVMVNSCKEIKADFLNYMMDTYKTIEPNSDQIESMFDAEHIGKFIVWQFVKEETNSFPHVFDALNKIFTQGDENALILAKYGIYQMMIYESKKLNVNYNSVFNPWLKGSIKDEWFILINEIDT